MIIDKNTTIRLGNRNIVKVKKGNLVIWEKSSGPVVEPDYFYVQNTYNGNNTVRLTGQTKDTYSSNHATTLQYSKDKNTWTTVNVPGTYSISLAAGEKVYFRNNNGYFNTYTPADGYCRMIFKADKTHNVGGNVNSLVDYEHMDTVVGDTGTFYGLFYQNNKLVDASNLVLPSTVTRGYFYGMFQECTALTTPPATIPTAGHEVCRSMFQDCTHLTTAPALPSTNLGGSGCYYGMFQNCIALTSAPSLPATTLTSNCYYNMFNGCSSLTTAPNLPATTLAASCYQSMFYGATSLVNVPSELPAINLTEACYRNMFRDCTSLTASPFIKAKTFATSSCYTMFSGCTALNSMTVYANDKSATDCTKSWLANVASSGTFTNYGSATYTANNTSGIPTGWSEVRPDTTDYFYVENTYAGTNTISLKDNESSILMRDLQYSKDKETWTTFTPSTTALNISLNQGEKLYIRGSGNKGGARLKISGSQAHIVGGNINTLIKYDDPNNVTLSGNAFYGLFDGDINLTSASNLTLPATTLADHCYQSMFNSCSALTTAPELPATTLAGYCYISMFFGCTALTTAPSLPATTLVFACYSNMFRGCSSLNSITCYAQDISAASCLFNWLENASSTGTFNNNSLVEYPSGDSGIPTGWTEIQPIQSIVADPDTFTLKSYKTKVRCESTLTITSTLGTTVTKTNSVTLTVGENTGDSTRTLTETIPYKGSSYQVTIVQTANDVKPVVSWNVVSTGTYPFQLNSNNYYESTNKGHDISYSYATLNYSGFDELVLECINSGEKNFDYGIISQPDVQLSESTTDDGATGSVNVFHNFKGQSSTTPVQIVIPSDGGSHFITIKFIKDGSSGQGNDSFQFKVIEP